MYNCLGEICVLILSTVLLFNTLFSFSLKERKNLLFLFCVACTLLAAFTNIISIYRIEHFDADAIPLSTAITSLFFLFLGLTPFIFVAYVFEVMSISWKSKRAFFVVLFVPISAFLVVLLLNFKFNLIFRYNPILGYTRGTLKNIMYVETVFYAALILAAVFCNRKILSRRMKITFVIYPILSLGIMLIQFFSTYLVMTGTVSFATLLLVYLSVQADLLEYDLQTGLLSGIHLESIVNKSPRALLTVISIENYAHLETCMSENSFRVMLQEISSGLVQCFGHNAYHVGANKFAVLSANVTTLKKDIRSFFEQFENFKVRGGTTCHVNFFAIVIELPSHAKNYSDAMELAEHLLLLARSSKDQKIFFCHKGYVDELNRTKTICGILERELDLDSSQFQIYFQPIYSAKERHFVFAEALARLVGTEIGDIMPAEFIPIAESRGLIDQLGKVVFEKACDFVSRHKDFVGSISVNFLIRQMVDPEIVDFVLETIERFCIKPGDVIIEITGSVSADEFNFVRRNMLHLSGKGVVFYFDDFGMGCLNFASVITLPIKAVKISRSFILMMEKNVEFFRFVKSFIQSLRDGSLKILVEGIETKAQDQMIMLFDVDYIQGFLYSRPVPEKEFLSMLENGGSLYTPPPSVDSAGITGGVR